MFITQLDIDLNQELQDWACSTLVLLTMHQFANGTLLNADDINKYYDAAKTKIVKIGNKKLPLITSNSHVTAFINDFDSLNEFTKEYFNYTTNLKYVGTIENNSLWIAPPYRNSVFWYEYSIVQGKTNTPFGKHFVLYKNGEELYNSNPNIQIISVINQLLFREVRND